jgi:uncharacterized protein YqeY
MMRERINAALKQAMLDQDKRRISTLRLINAAIKDRDIAARSAGRDPVGKSFLPRQLEEDEMRSVCAEAIKATGSHGLRDMGRCMQALKERYAGRMDFGKASQIVKQQLG